MREQMAGFEEKQFEFACNLELAMHTRRVFPPGQVLEAVLGYDVAAYLPAHSPLWGLLGQLPRRIRLRLTPNFWNPVAGGRQLTQHDLPRSYISLVFQYKASSYVQHGPLWLTPYYRFRVRRTARTAHTLPQHTVLQTLQRRLNRRGGFVYYAAPVFHDYGDLQLFQMRGLVFEHTTFVTPRRIGGHRAWTYNQAGTRGRPNPEGRSSRCPSFNQIMDTAKQQSRRETLDEHVRRLAAALKIDDIKRTAMPKWLRDFSRSHPELTLERVRAAHDVLEVAASIGKAGANWMVVDVE